MFRRLRSSPRNAHVCFDGSEFAKPNRLLGRLVGDLLKPLKEARITGYRGPSAAAGFYIADEPETHLHPAAVQSVRNWLSRLSETATTVLVATYSPARLDSAARQVHRTHDQIILEEWFGQDLRAAGVRVYPVHSTDNMPGLAESEITAALGIWIATLTDGTSVQRGSTGTPQRPARGQWPGSPGGPDLPVPVPSQVRAPAAVRNSTPSAYGEGRHGR